MPLYEIALGNTLVPFRRLKGGAELYEHEIETLFWEFSDEFLGEPLLLIARQPQLPSGGRPDVIALSKDARVVIIEIKRDVDRGQLAQCLEYAGWARTTSLDELAKMYHRGPDSFFTDWQEFTESSTPQILNRRPRLVLIARGFHGRTQSALEFLVENGLPVQILEVSIYEDVGGRRFLDIEGEREPELVIQGEEAASRMPITGVDGRRIRISDLLEAELLQAGDELVWQRPRLGVTYKASVLENGAIELSDGQTYASPSLAAMRAAGIQAYDGWYAWKVPRLSGVLLHELRKEFAARLSQSESDSAA